MAQAVGFFTDTTVCIGCKACEVACHQWNALPARDGGQVPLSGLQLRQHRSAFSDVDWRHVKFVEQFSDDRSPARWLMMSDVCKHCVNAPCLEVCPTGAIVRTEFDTVYIQEPACNGCRDCIAACPFGVIHVIAPKHIAQKCTFCYDRLQNGLVPACAQACPTALDPVRADRGAARRRAARRVEQLHGQGASRGLPLRRRRQDPRRAERLLPPDGQARDLRPARPGRSPKVPSRVALAVVAQGRSPPRWRWRSGRSSPSGDAGRGARGRRRRRPGAESRP